MSPVVTVIIPAYNEEARVAATVVAAAAIPGVSEVLVVDDGSLDRTAETAALAGARVIRLTRNRGKGAALAAGIEAARHEILLFLDADLAESASLASALLEPVLAEKADMTIAVLPATGGGGGFGLAKGLAAWGLRRLTGRLWRAPLSGQRALRRRFVQNRLLGRGWGIEVALTADVIWQGGRVQEVPVAFRHRVTGWDWRGILHRGRQCRDVALALAPRLLRPRS